MKSEIIRSGSTLKRYAGLSFALSLIFTGLGQVYNGDFSRGIVFFILRILSLIMIPLFAIREGPDFPVQFFITAAAAHCLIWLISPAEAMFSSRVKNSFSLKKYNSILFYLLYALIASAFMIFSVLFILSFFSIAKVKTGDMYPGLAKDDYVLINKYAAKSLDAGDVVVYPSNNTMAEGRIIAMGDDMVNKKGNGYYINDTPLAHGIFSKGDTEKMGLDNSEDLFYETNGGKKYPVRLGSAKIKKQLIDPVLPGRDKLFIAFDNRSKNDLHEMIDLSAVIGRAECIIYSKQRKRIFSKMYLKAE